MNEDKAIQKLVEHDEKLDKIQETLDTQVVKKDDIRDMQKTLDVIVTEVKKIREGHVFVVNNVKQLDKKVEKQNGDIKNIKVQLQMA